jgi:opacity protein-like surface antigen
MKPFLTVALVLLFYAQFSFAQQHEAHEPHQENSEQVEEHTQEHPHHKHMISVEIGHSHLSEGVRNGEKEWITVPSWAINYNYRLNEKWILGVHTDIIIENFEVKTGRSDAGSGTIERSRPISVVGVAAYEVMSQLAVLSGVGFEYAPEETFTIIRLGVEPAIPINERLEVIFSMVYDIKVNAYNNWAMGAGLGFMF